MESSRLATETASLRLAMFTRRIVHRNNLGNHGIIVSTLPQGTKSTPKLQALAPLPAANVSGLSSLPPPAAAVTASGTFAGKVEIDGKSAAPAEAVPVAARSSRSKNKGEQYY